MPLHKGPYCCARNCGNNRGRNPGLSFFTFPKDLERCRQWIINAGFTDSNVEQFSRRKALCSEHFERSHFTSELRRALVWNAVPTLFSWKEPVSVISVKRIEALLPCAPTKVQPSEGNNKIEKSSSPQTGVLHTDRNIEIAGSSCTPEKSVDPILLQPVTLTKGQEIRRLIKLPPSFTPGKSVKVTPILLRPANVTTDQIQQLKKKPPSITPGKSVDPIVLRPVTLTKDQQEIKRLKILPFSSSTPDKSGDPNVSQPVRLIKHNQEIEILHILPPSCTRGKSGDPNLPEPVTFIRNQPEIQKLKNLPSSGTLGKPNERTVSQPATVTEGQLEIKSLEKLTSSSTPRSSADETLRQKDLLEIRRLRKLLHSRQTQIVSMRKRNKQLRKEVRENSAQLLKNSRRSRKIVLNEDVQIVTKIASKYLSEKQVNFFAMQMRMSSVVPEGRRWTEQDKHLGQSILAHGREGYEQFAKYFDLPSLRTLQKFKLPKKQ